MRLLIWIGGSHHDPVEPRSLDEIHADLETLDAVHLQRLTRIEESLFTLTAEVGLEDLRRRMEARRRD